jgi:hypothetical protein
MAHEPFLLDPSYDGLLNSDAFRAHYLRGANRQLLPAWLIVLFPFLALTPSLIFLVVGLFDPQKAYFGVSAGLALFFSPVFLFIPTWLRQERKSREFNRRFAQECQKLTGRVVSCVRKQYPKQAYEGVVEVVYTVRTPSGVELKGTKAMVRGDLLNATLPRPGAPVVVLVLDDRWHLMV